MKDARKSKKKRNGGGSALTPIVLIGAGMALMPLVQKLKDWLKERQGGGEDESGSAGEAGKGKGKVNKGKGSKGGKGKGATADAGMKKPPGAAAAKVDRGGSMPRSGKMASNKKNKARKAEKRAEIEQKREEEAAAAAKGGGKKGGKPGEVVIQKGNNVPKDEDIVGGEAGKTFTTTSHVKVPTWYAKVREERGNQ